jgi:hypothetical protein
MTRVKISEIPDGSQYFSVYSATGVCIGRYLTEAEAQASVAVNPERRDYREHYRWPG